MVESDRLAASQLQRLFATAVECFEAGDILAGQATLEDLLTKVPDHPQVLNYLAVTVHRGGNPAKALALLKRAIAVLPGFAEAWNNLGQLALELGDSEAAIEAFTTLRQLAPDHPDPIINLAHALQAGGRCGDAIEPYREGLAKLPNHPSAWTALCRALLFEGRWREAVAAADCQLAIRPGQSGALALKSVALQELGATEAWLELVDFDRLIEAFEIAVPAGYADLTAFNRALSDYGQNHPTLEYAPKDKTTELGYQSANLAGELRSPIADLLAIVGDCADRYRAARPLVFGHPYLGQRPENWHYDIWATVLESGGHQASHIHRDGWLSGVYYAQVPAVINGQELSDDNAGWIEFGRPQFYPKAQAAPVTRCYPPAEGRLYLFPSYFYHRTVPFQSETRRISIAFDLLPGPKTREVRLGATGVADRLPAAIAV